MSMATRRFKAKCERDGTVFEGRVLDYKMPRDAALKANMVWPAKLINCPTCCRGYFLERDGVWRADRPLTILE